MRRPSEELRQKRRRAGLRQVDEQHRCCIFRHQRKHLGAARERIALMPVAIRQQCGHCYKQNHQRGQQNFSGFHIRIRLPFPHAHMAAILALVRGGAQKRATGNCLFRASNARLWIAPGSSSASFAGWPLFSTVLARHLLAISGPPLASLVPNLLFLCGLSSAGVAQLVEHLICNQRVGGSIPSASSSSFEQGSEAERIPTW
jgi:hypothetical protein